MQPTRRRQANAKAMAILQGFYKDMLAYQRPEELLEKGQKRQWHSAKGAKTNVTHKRWRQTKGVKQKKKRNPNTFPAQTATQWSFLKNVGQQIQNAEIITATLTEAQRTP